MSDSPPKWECDVFVSFTHTTPQAQGFTRDLLKRLYQVGIAHCSDEKTNAPGEFKGNDNEALEQVRFALVVLSNECFDGLVERLNGMKKPKLVVIAICYHIDRAKASHEFANALREKDGEIWGYDLKDANDNEGKKLIDKIVVRLVNEIFSRPTENTTEKFFGPYGGKNETPWSSYEIKNGISVEYNEDGIKCITFEVNDGADTKEAHGNNGRDRTYKVKFQNEEYITSFAGYFDNANGRITGLTFRTSKGMLGPFGKPDGEYFYVPPKGGDVIEFFGRWEKGFLTSIGARVTLVPEPVRPFIVQHAELIGRTKYKWDDGHHHANVRKIIGKGDSKSETIRSIEFEYQEIDGKFWESEPHGLTDGNNFSTEIEMGPREHLTTISAVCEGDNIKSLEFVTGEKKIKTIGVDKKNDERGVTRKTISIPNCIIVGFYGWSDEDGCLCGIGAYFKGRPTQHGDRWNDKKFSGVRKIYLWLDKNDSHIRGIRFVYEAGSGNVEMVHHGDLNALDSCQEKKYELDYRGEYLTSISGCTQKDDTIKSLTFHSNRKNYPENPHPKVGESCFWYPSTGSRITGFYGTFDNNNALQSIGVYAKALDPSKASVHLETTGAFGRTDHGDDWDDEVYTDVRAFRLSYDKQGIHSISFMYDDNGSLVEGPQRGGGDVGKWYWLDFPNERLKSITVWKSSKANDVAIRHLQITTTAYTHGPYPDMTKGKLHQDEIKLYHDRTGGGSRYNRVGFFGKAGSYLNAIGAHFEPN